MLMLSFFLKTEWICRYSQALSQNMVAQSVLLNTVCKAVVYEVMNTSQILESSKTI